MEILKATSRTREYIERGESEGKSLMDAMDQGEVEGMQTFDTVIEKMIRAGTVSRDDGLAYASNYGNLLLKLSDLGGGGGIPKQAAEPKIESMLDMIE